MHCVFVCVCVNNLPPITVMIMTKSLQENNDESNQWLYQTELQCGLFAETQESNGVCFAYITKIKISKL